MKKLTFLLAFLLTLPFVQAQTAGEGFDVKHYEIHLSNFDFANHTLQGEAFIEITATTNLNTAVLELMSLTVTDVNCDFTSVESFNQEGNFLTIHFAETILAGESVILDVRYGGSTFNESWGGVHWWGSDYVYNLGVGFDSQPHNLGKTWFPCVDNFTDKAHYDLFITTTSDKKAVCGGNLVEATDNGDGTTTWHWNTPQEIATYHISFAVGNYELWEDSYRGLNSNIAIEVYAKPNQMNKVPGTFVHIKEIIAFYEEHLGAYPFNRVGYVSTEKGCMEHTDNIAFAASLITGNTSGESYVAHELSHMWSGNLVTCAEAGDMWLNEGFAQFWGVFYEAGIYGEPTFQNTISTKVDQIVNWCNTPANWMPLNNIPLDLTYDNKAVYERGAVIVNTMMNYMGRETFLSAMRDFFQQYAFQAATSQQLCEALTQSSGIDMNGFFDTYVYSSGMPFLYGSVASVTPVGNQFEVQLDLRYQHIGDTHIGQNNKYELTFIGPDFQLVTEKLGWDGLHGNAIVTLDFEPVAVINDLNNNWLDGNTQRYFMLKPNNTESFANFLAKAETMADSSFVSVVNHLVGPYDDPLIEGLTLSPSHFWTISRYDFGEANIRGQFNYSKSQENDIIQSENDSITLLYRKNASEPWREIEHTLHPQSTWQLGRIYVEDFPSGDYAFAVWNKEQLALPEQEGIGSLKLYPNPAQGQVVVGWKGVAEGQIVLCDTEGRTLKTALFAQTEQITLALPDLVPGCYFVRKLDKNGTILETQKLIIK